MLVPVALIRQERAREVAAQIPGALNLFEDSVITGLRIYLEYGRLARYRWCSVTPRR